jgi:uncharacterized membrane protein YhaH (DUF805 family)
MTTPHPPVPVTPRQLVLRRFCIWLENKFECRIDRFAFAMRMALAAIVFYALFFAQTHWLPKVHGALAIPHGLLFAWAAFWGILQIVRRFHDLGRTGGLFWAIVIPFWAAWKLEALFPDLWILWVALSAWSIWLTLQLFFKGGTDGANRYDSRQPPSA